MGKIAVVYWSGTGNTEEMAGAVLDGICEGGKEGELYNVCEFSENDTEAFDAIAFGCPATGNEELEEDEFEPFFSKIEDKLCGKRIALFGSYGWGGGEWMREWEARCKERGAVLAARSVICNEAPDGGAIDECRKMGKALAQN
ncbi:MAG: flavodoxin [Ruminococcaceae bacterium]|nr:flavodoxin [Oscillospiraceae bacterium]